MKDLIIEARELCADAQLEAALLELKTMSGWLNKVVYHKPGIRWSFDNNNLIHWIVVFMRLLPELCDALEKAKEQNKQLVREVSQLAAESVKRDVTLARLEAEVEAWAKAEQEGRLVVLPCKVGDTVYTVGLDCEDNPDHTKMCFCWNKSCKVCEKAYLRVWENRTKTTDIRSIVSEMGLCGEKGGFGKTVFLTREEAEEALKGVTP